MVARSAINNDAHPLQTNTNDTLGPELQMFSQLIKLSEIKNAHLPQTEDWNRIIAQQLNIISSITKHPAQVESRILQELTKELSNSYENELLAKLENITPAQEQVFVGSLHKEIRQIKDILGMIQYTLLMQRQEMGKNLDKLGEFLAEEGKAIAQLQVLLSKDAEFSNKVSAHLDMVRNLKHSPTFQRIARRLAKLVIYRKFAVIVTGQEKIPHTGPVLIAPRHFDGDHDPSLMLAITTRRVFFLAATDFVNDGFRYKMIKFFHRKLGAASIDRMDSFYNRTNRNPRLQYLNAGYKIVNLLLLGQAVIIFPEGWPDIDSHKTLKDDANYVPGVQKGALDYVHLAQKRQRFPIPIVPVGIRYEMNTGGRPKIFVNIGNPFVIPLTEEGLDFAPYEQRLYQLITSLSSQ
jgi:1-acyl-sn-glycerol-3-phosphate acyltransferase